MNLTSLTSLNQYVKTLKLQTVWNLKQEQGAYGAQGKRLEDWLQTPTASAPGRASGEQEDTKLTTIQMKVYNGKTLTQKELDYLREKDPETYQKARAMERSKRAYEEALRRCRTKEEVERLRLSHLSASLSTVNAVKNNPHIPKARKLEILMMENGKLQAQERLTRAFMQTREYARLPSEWDREHRDWVEISQGRRPEAFPASPEEAPEWLPVQEEAPLPVQPPVRREEAQSAPDAADTEAPPQAASRKPLETRG